MHNVMNIAHLDISLENIVVSEDTFFDRESGKIKNLDVRIIDFGLSHLFGTNDNFLICDKFVGKMGYKSPQIFKCEAYCGNKADIWSLGITLFMMIVGAPPFHKASDSDAAFAMIMNGEMMTMLARWNR